MILLDFGPKIFPHMIISAKVYAPKEQKIKSSVIIENVFSLCHFILR